MYKKIGVTLMMTHMERGGEAPFFFFKQKTAYEISECDWSSDVCFPIDRKSTRLNSSHIQKSRMPSSACARSSDVCSPGRSESTRLNSRHIQTSRMPSSA